MAITTLINSNRERHFLPRSARAAILACVRGVDLFKRPSSIFSFGFRYLEKVTPGHIIDGFSEMVVLDHPVDIQGFNLDGVKSFNQVMANFVMKVFSTIGDALMFQCNYATGASAVRAALRFAGKSLLRQLEFSAGFLQRARVGNSFPVRERGKVGYASVNPDAQASLGERRGLVHFTHQADIPTGSASGYSQLFNCTRNFAREAHAATAHTRDIQFIPLQRAFLARVNLLAETIVTVFAFEARKASFPATLFQAAKESGKSQVQSFQHVGLDVPVTIQDVGQFFLGLSQLSGLLVKIERFTLASQRQSLAKVADALFQGAVPQEAALVQSILTRFNERLIRAQFELESLGRRVIIRFSHCRLLLQNKGLW